VTRFNRVFSCTPLEVVLWGEQATSFPADQISIAGQDSLQIIIFVGTCRGP
jgi:replication factor A1